MSRIASAAARAAISIPKRIQRGPTDILKALSNTVLYDRGTPEFKYYDDPYTIPGNFNNDRLYTYSKASGIRAARFMISKYPQAFFKDDCVPHVPAFFPERVITEQEQAYPDETLIYSYIDIGKLIEAFNVYQKCKDQNIEVSETCKLALFEVLCQHNNQDIKEVLPEEIFHVMPQRQASQSDYYMTPSKWKEDCPANIMFNELSSKTTAMYCSLIKVMVKNNEYDKTIATYNMLKENNSKIDVETYNTLIEFNTVIDKSKGNKANLVLDLLNDMKLNGVKPSLNTFINCFRVLDKERNYNNTKALAFSILSEMKLLGLNNRHDNGQTLTEVLKEIEKCENLEIISDCDSEFFPVAISKCVQFELNIEVVNRVHALLLKGLNRKFIVDVRAKMNYFERYFRALFSQSTPQHVMEQWEEVIPNLTSASRDILLNMIQYVTQHQCYEFMPRLWSDVVEYRILRSIRDDLLSKFIDSFLFIMNKYKIKEGDEFSENLIKQYGEIVRSILKTFPIDPKQPQFIWTSEKMIETTIQLLVKADDFESAWNVFDLCLHSKQLYHEGFSEATFSLLFQLCYNKQLIGEALKVLGVSAKLGFKSCVDHIIQLNENIPLTQEQK